MLNIYTAGGLRLVEKLPSDCRYIPWPRLPCGSLHRADKRACDLRKTRRRGCWRMGGSARRA